MSIPQMLNGAETLSRFAEWLVVRGAPR